MEAVNPLLHVALAVKTEIETGLSVQQALNNYIKKNGTSLAQRLGSWLLSPQRNHLELMNSAFRSPEGRMLLVIFSQGLEGRSIHGALTQLISEIELQSDLAVEEFVRQQPLKALIPLVCFLFPAFLMLILGPILSQLLAAPI